MNRSDRTFVTTVLAFTMVMAVGWLFYLPIFLNPDEDSHYDYALTLFSAGRTLAPSEHTVGRDTDPVVEYLMRATGARQARIDVSVPAPPGYGTPAFFHRLDTEAPHPRFDHPIDPAPYIGRFYPIGYYAMAAGAIAIGDAIFAHSIVAQFFAARALSVLFLVPTIVFGWLVLIELRVPKALARAILVCVALMPLTAWMAASVQPDTLVCALISPIGYVALRLRRDPTNPKLLTILAILLAVLSSTKRHYFLAMYLPVAAMLAVRVPWRSAPTRALAILAIVTTPAAIAIVLTENLLHPAQAATGLCQVPSHLKLAAQDGLGILFHFLTSGMQNAIVGTFFGDDGLSFWTNYTAYRNQSLVIISRSFTSALVRPIPALSVLIAVLFIVRLIAIAKRLSTVAKYRSLLVAARLATSNVAVNGFITFGVILYAFQIFDGGETPMQGRYWLPFMPIVWLITFSIAPQGLPDRFRDPVRNVAVVLVMAFGILASAYTFPSLRTRFYSEPTYPKPQQELTSAIWAGKAGDYVRINGVAYDLRSAAPVQRVILKLDGQRDIVTTAFDRPDVQCDMEQTLLHVGFLARLPIAGLRPGEHTVEVFVQTAWHRGLIATGTQATFSTQQIARR